MSDLNHTNEAPLSADDAADEAELKRLYEAHNSQNKVPQETAQADSDTTLADNQGLTEVELNELLGEEQNENPSSSEIAHDDSPEEKPEEDKAPADDDDLFNVDDLNLDTEGLVKPDDPVGVQKRINKIVQERNALKARLERIEQHLYQQSGTPQIAGQAPQPAVNPSVAQMPPANFQQVSQEQYEKMNDLERLDYLDSFRQAQRAQAARIQQEQQQQMWEQQQVVKVINAVQEKMASDPDMMEVYTRSSFTKPMLSAISDEPHAAHILKYLHKTKPAEVMKLATLSADSQKIQMAKWAAEYSFELKSRQQKAAVKPKPTPAGRIKSATHSSQPTVKTKFYTKDVLEKLADDPIAWQRAIDRGM